MAVFPQGSLHLEFNPDCTDMICKCLRIPRTLLGTLPISRYKKIQVRSLNYGVVAVLTTSPLSHRSLQF